MIERRKPLRFPRLEELILEAGFVPFQRAAWVNPRTGRADRRVLGERPRYRFLVARDEWNRTFAPLVLNPGETLMYAGWPVEPDDALATGEIVFVSDAR